MTLAVKKHFFKEDFWAMMALKVMNAMQVSNFCCLLSLRQGALLIGVIELSLTSFALFLLSLGVTHAQDIIALASADLQQLEESDWSVDNYEQSSMYFPLNEKRLLNGQHLASIIMILVYTALVLACIHFISCLSLIYGAIRKSPNFLLPWTTTVLFSLISGCFFLLTLVFLPSQECHVGPYAAGTFLVGLEFYAWLVVISYYRELTT